MKHKTGRSIISVCAISLCVFMLLSIVACTEDINEFSSDNDSNVLPQTVDMFTSAAKDFVLSSPTYSFDGNDIELTDYKIVNKTEHVLTFTFTSSNSGYGNRENITADNIQTAHLIVVKIVGTQVMSAVIDEKWDELAQQSIG